MRSLEPFMAGRTVLIISHHRTAAGHANQTITLENGRILQPAPVAYFPMLAAALASNSRGDRRSLRLDLRKSPSGKQ